MMDRLTAEQIEELERRVNACDVGHSCSCWGLLRDYLPTLLADARENEALRRECKARRKFAPLEKQRNNTPTPRPADMSAWVKALHEVDDAALETDRLGALEGE